MWTRAQIFITASSTHISKPPKPESKRQIVSYLASALVAVAIVAASSTLCDRRTRVPSALVTSTPGLFRGEGARLGEARGEARGEDPDDDEDDPGDGGDRRRICAAGDRFIGDTKDFIFILSLFCHFIFSSLTFFALGTQNVVLNEDYEDEYIPRRST